MFLRYISQFTKRHGSDPDYNRVQEIRIRQKLEQNAVNSHNRQYCGSGFGIRDLVPF
jgi:hypothetical protein